MASVFVNGLNSKAGGGKRILDDYLAFLGEKRWEDRFFVLVPNKSEYVRYACGQIEIIDIARCYKSNLLFPFVNRVVLPRLLRQLRIDVILNLSDVVIPTDIRQLYMFDWAYAVYPRSIAWQRMDHPSRIRNRIKLFFFKKYIRYSRLVVVQSKTMKQRMEALYGVENAEIVPSAVPRGNLTGGEPHDFGLPADRLKLLCLTRYYPHKNIEVFLPLAQKVKRLGLGYCIIITIKGDQDPRAGQFLRALKNAGLEDTILNLGPVPPAHVSSLYHQCDALLLPTLLESYGLTYVEAMHHQLPILTSNLDFAVDVCGESAYYFDPLDTESILKTIKMTFQDPQLRQKKIAEGQRRLRGLPNWRQVFDRYHALLGVETGRAGRDS
jgi:glycosyltransferase involved in cell wall biosynthesis